MRERDDLQVVSPIPVDEKEGKVSQWEATYTAARTLNDFADQGMFGDQIDNRLYVVPQPVPQMSRL